MSILSINDHGNSVLKHCRNRAALSNELPRRRGDTIINELQELAYSLGALLTQAKEVDSIAILLPHLLPQPTAITDSAD
jgi:hypothetical protein|nr:MetaGeneMark_Unknown Function [uncultured bacterium]